MTEAEIFAQAYRSELVKEAELKANKEESARVQREEKEKVIKAIFERKLKESAESAEK